MKRFSFSLQLLLGLVVGIALGFVAKVWDVAWLAETLKQVGSLFVQLLKLAVPPLVFTAVLVSVANLRNVNGAARLASKTLMWFLITAFVSVSLAIGLGLLINPGQGVTLDTSAAKATDTQGTWLDFVTGILPTNVVTAFTEVNVLQIVFLGIVLGAAAMAVGEKAEPFLNLARSVLELVQKALWWVIRLAPIGTAGLIGKAVSTYGWELLAPLAKFSAGVYIGCFIVLLAVYPTLLAVWGKVSPVTFFRNAWPAIELAFVSRSSVGTLPLTQRVTVERNGVDRDYASFAVPFGATTKMDGCASVYPALAAIFVAQVFGVPLGFGDYLLIAFVSVVGSAATAGLTGATVMLTLTLSTLGLPLEGVGLLLAIDPILDMIRTATNVTGQMVVPVLVARSEGRLDTATFNAPPQPLDSAPVRRVPEPATA
ncbi:Proton/glutamate symport protein @ Sodium/glutamate symport protein [[Actinomadura] parvosata subsp. kistnae]|uniref:Sodium:proton antiporter n=1 Tax=[Actinomadura] parvosata subsp. kistnae TaxID=1909395 RepID=A0A1V0A3R2_9ACTN|nr:dicarboxylate/amino acid:cation symporter [Nonomuraea sp. ATCC 55076]AQZ64828.1 sodium:proton antiporter [Nonomuraea sp. ATCC 55076]SPL96026.1 Proton/glutamate symport protein @ Sodium/glutamate symport protein [Actinomadura parvosata subsp. kistnae]